MREITRDAADFICNDDFAPVVSFPYTNLVMWSQTGSDVTLMYRGDLFLRGFDLDVREHEAAAGPRDQPAQRWDRS